MNPASLFFNSTWLVQDITCGVPQGSILGPLLFIIYINDLCHASEFFDLNLFADDTILFCSGDNLRTLTQILVISWPSCLIGSKQINFLYI